uniref:Ig-like domain-containing protein n=1 Tax=Oncorhynchus mykiss TaxID=8022 RepID=A0A8C7LRN4_ONCMY
MFRLCLVLVLIQALDTEDISHPSPLLHAHLGDNVILQCFYPDRNSYISWYKLAVGQKPQLVSTIYKYDGGAQFHTEFKDNPRFTVCVYNLPKRNLRLSDAGTYYCAVASCGEILFGNGTKLDIDHKSPSQSQSDQPGDSVTLNCTIHTETCAGEHSVYWFRHGSGESRPGIIYTHGDRSDQCEKSPEAGSPTQSCVYNLPKRNLSLSDAGTYYCAVASCGEILFGNGTKLDIKEPLLLVYCLSSALGLSFILITVLGFVMYNMNKRKCLQCRDSLHYVALNLSNKKNRFRRQRSNMEEETVYSGIRQ